MKNHKELIQRVLANHGISAQLVEDANETIDSLFASPEFNWYPTYLARQDKTFFMFAPFSFEGYVSKDEFQAEYGACQYLLKELAEKDISTKVFFIISQVEDQEILESMSLSDEFGIVYDGAEQPVLESSMHAGNRCRIISAAPAYLAVAENLRGDIGKIVRRFSNKYLKRTFSSEEEETFVRDFLEEILSCDKRFNLSSRSIRLTHRIEQHLKESSANVRDHYFHACNTMLIGFMVLNEFYDLFDSLMKSKYGDDLNLEFVWAVAALYHDIGYPASLQTHMMSEAYGIAVDEAIVETCARQNRLEFWNSKYQTAAFILSDLFQHVWEGRKGIWAYDCFDHKKEQVAFVSSIKTAFIEKGCHGAQGVLILVHLINDIIRNLDNATDRQFLYRHIVIAALSILFHDMSVRNAFRNNDIRQLKMSDFPLAGLLTYLDVLQDDRRDLSGSISRPDIFVGIESNKGCIRAKLDIRAFTDSTKEKLLSEMRDVLDFFEMNGITLLIPGELAA